MLASALSGALSAVASAQHHQHDKAHLIEIVEQTDQRRLVRQFPLQECDLRSIFAMR